MITTNSRTASGSVEPGARLLVVTPTLGTSPFLPEAVRSIQQLGINLEHVLVAPASMVKDLQAQYPWTRVVPEPERGGMYAAINEGVRLARSDWNWFTYLNDDDTLELFDNIWARRLCKSEGHASAIYGRCQAMDAFGRFLFDINVARNGQDLASLFRWGIVALNQQGLFFSRVAWQRIGRFDESFSHGGDVDAIICGLNAGVEYVYSDSICGHFRVHQSQLSKNAAIMRSDFIRALGRLRVGRRSLGPWLRFRLDGIGIVARRICKMGLLRTRKIYETQQ